MELGCKNCNHKWNYSGSQEYWATCPNCRWKVSLLRYRKVKELEKKIKELEEMQSEKGVDYNRDA